jgi:hypothetical protein
LQIKENEEINRKKLDDTNRMKVWNQTRPHEDTHDLKLNEDWKQKVQSWKGGLTIGGFKSLKEMLFFGCLMHNSVPKLFYFNQKEFEELDPSDRDTFRCANECQCSIEDYVFGT